MTNFTSKIDSSMPPWAFVQKACPPGEKADFWKRLVEAV
jgi:hypothetical protein